MPRSPRPHPSRGAVRVGTSGYMYDHWRGHLFPEGLPKSRWLARYASFFNTVELNNTFYRLASARAVDAWRVGTPDHFLFACKGSRFLTHMKKLTDPASGLEKFFAPVNRLGEKLGPILWQLPPQMNRADPARLRAFIGALPRHVRHVFEFRDAAWYTQEITDTLDELGCAICEHDLLPVPVPRATGGFRYVRFHGASGKYDGLYGREALREPARDLARWCASGRDVYVFFNNDMHGCAVYDALTMASLLGIAAPVLTPAAAAGPAPHPTPR